MSSASAVKRAEFARLMAALGPFELCPHLAVAVSGGRDSMALALLAARWAETRGGRITALTVDHGLRAGSRAEARRVRRWLGTRGIAHRILTWQGPKPKANVQGAARAARYRLLTDWCERQGVLHLLTAHQAEDQAETVLLRLARGSGIDGLAGMAGLSELPSVRVLRPLLPVARARLEATLAAAGQGWIDDPTNGNTAHARIRMRALAPALAAEGLTVERLARTARHIAEARAGSEGQVAAILARTARIYPAGYCEIDLGSLLEAPAPTALRALSAVLQTIAGAAYPPRFERLDRLARALRTSKGGGFTLGGCRILRQPRSRFWLVCREPAAIGGAVRLMRGRRVIWDGRFSFVWPGQRGRRDDPPMVGACGGGRSAKARGGPTGALPAVVAPSLPALWRGRTLLALPSSGAVSGTRGRRWAVRCRFSPQEPLARAPFAVV